MALYIVRKPNETFKPGTHLELTDEGFQKVILKPGPTGGWIIGERIGLIVPFNAGLHECCINLDGRHSLPADILARIREEWGK